MMNLQGKITGFDFYEALDKLTNNTGLGTIKVSDLLHPLLGIVLT